jgi:hypothetical protein
MTIFSKRTAACLVAASVLIMHQLPLAAQVASLSLPDAPLPQQSTPQPTSPPASTDNSAPLSFSDLGLNSAQTQGNAQAQARLDKRTHMLKVHQRLGLLTTIPLAATLISSGMAPCDKNCSSGNSAGTYFHASLGTVTVGMYAATAYYAIAAPKIAGTQKHGAIRWHEALALVHGTGMILTPVLGAMALNQQNQGQKVSGIASAHGAVAITTGIAYAASIVAVSWPIKVKFWESQQ